MGRLQWLGREISPSLPAAPNFLHYFLRDPVVSPPQVPVVVQPQAPTIVVGPTPQPNIIFAAPAPSAPTISYMVQGNAPVANAPTGNAPQQIFMANAPQPAAGAPQPMAMAPQPVAMAPQPMAPQPMAPQPMAPQPMAMAPQPMAMAPQPMAMAPVGQAPTGQSPALLAAVLTNPSIFGRILGAIGEHLAQKKKAHPAFRGVIPKCMRGGYNPVLGAGIWRMVSH